MEQEPSDKKNLDRLFDFARTEDPVMSPEEIAGLIKTQGEQYRIKGKQRRRRNLLIIGLVSVLLLGSYWLFNRFSDTHEQKGPMTHNPLPVIGLTGENQDSLPYLDEAERNEQEELSPEENDQEEAESFPPAYQEENISRPPHETNQSVSEKRKSTQEKTSGKTLGPATITFVSDNQNIKLILETGTVQALWIDGRKIEPGSYEQYRKLIDEGIQLEQQSRRQKDEQSGLSELEREHQKQNEILTNTLVKALARDGLISEGKPFEFRLRWNNLEVDGIKQGTEQYEKYRALYEEASGKKLSLYSDIRIGH